MIETTITTLEIIVLVFIAGLIVYIVYRTGHTSGFDSGARSDAKEFYPQSIPCAQEIYPPQAAGRGGCVNHECTERDGCACYTREEG